MKSAIFAFIALVNPVRIMRQHFHHGRFADAARRHVDDAHQIAALSRLSEARMKDRTSLTSFLSKNLTPST